MPTCRVLIRDYGIQVWILFSSQLLRDTPLTDIGYRILRRHYDIIAYAIVASELVASQNLCALSPSSYYLVNCDRLLRRLKYRGPLCWMSNCLNVFRRLVEILCERSLVKCLRQILSWTAFNSAVDYRTSLIPMFAYISSLLSNTIILTPWVKH